MKKTSFLTLSVKLLLALLQSRIIIFSLHTNLYARHNEDIKYEGLKWNNVRVIENDYEEELNIFCEFSYSNLQRKHTASIIIKYYQSILNIIVLVYIQIVSMYLLHTKY